MNPVTDPVLLEELERGSETPSRRALIPVEDPALLEQLETPALAFDALDADPDKVVRARAMARQADLPPSVVEADPGRIAQRLRREEIEQRMETSPALARMMADRDTARVAHDDVENLGFLDRTIGALRRGWQSFRQGHAAVAVGSNARTIANLDDVERRLAAGEEIADADDWLGVRWLTPEQRATLRAELTASVTSGATNIAEREARKRDTVQALPAVQAAQAAKDFATFWQHFKHAPVEFIANVSAESFASSAASLAALAAPGVGLAARAGAVGATSYAADYGGSILGALADEGVDLRDRDAILAATRNPELMARVGRKAAAHAAATATLDAASGGIAGKSLTTGRLSNITAQAVVQGAMGAAGEITGTIAAGDELHAGNIAAEFFGEFALSPLEVTAASANVIVENHRKRTEQAKANGKALGDAMTAAGASKLNERDQELLARFANEAAEGESIFVDANTLAQAARTAGVDMGQLAQRIPSLAEQLEQAESTGADVEIPAGDALAYLQPIASTLVEHGRIGSPEAPTVAETYAQSDTRAEVARELAGVEVENAQQVARTVELATVQDAIEQQIAATGRFTEDVGTRYASLLSAMFHATASRLGVDVAAVYDEFTPRIVSDIGEGVQALDQSHRGAYDPATRTIALLQSADLSTFLHEAGHFGLEMMVDLADRSPDIGRDVAMVMQSFGTTLEQWREMTLEQRRAHHEQFARSFEAYLFEGKAPSVELQSTFARFRSWLLAVYRNLSALNVELSAEVREVFDRMLATDDQIAARSAPTLSLAGLADPAELAAYQALAAEAQADAVADLQARALRDMGRTRRAHGREMQRIRARLAEARAQIEAQVSLYVAQEPAFAARAALTAAPVEGKLSTRMLAELYGSPESVFGRFDWSSVQHLAAEKGQHPDIVAEHFGFSSGDQLVRALVAAGDPAQHVGALVDQRMLETFGELTTEEGIAAAADAAVANEHHARVLLMAANALRRATGQRPILMREARARAEMALAGRRIRDVKPGVYKVAEAKAQRKAAEAQARGRIAEAAAHARDALLANAYAREARRIHEEFDKGRAYLRKFETATGSASIAPEYVEQIRNVLSAIDTRSQTNRRLDSLESLRKWIARQEEAGLPAAIDPELLAELQVDNVRELTAEQFRGLVDQVKSIEHLGRLKQKLLTARDQRSFDAYAEELAASIRKHGGAAKPIEADRGRWDRAASKIRAYFAEHRKFASLARQMDGGVDAGPMWRALVRPMNDAGNLEAQMRMEATEELHRILRPVEALPGGLGQKIEIPEIGRSLSRQARIAIALNMGNETNRQRIAGGENWGAAQLQAITKTLTATEWQAVQNLWTYLDSYWPAIAAKEQRVFGVAPERVQALPFTVTSSDGVVLQLSGGYYPIAYDPVRSDVQQSHDAATAAKEMLAAAYTRATTRRGHTKARVGEVKRPIDLSLSPVFRHLTQVTHDLSHHEWLIDAERLLRDGRIADAIREHYSPEVLKSLRATVRDVAAGDVAGAGTPDRIVARMRASTTAAVMGWSMTTSLLQPFGLAQSIVRIGPQYVLKGVARWAGDAVHMRNSMRWIGEKSSFMKQRNRTLLREMNEVSQRVGGRSAKAQAFDAFKFVFMQKMQLIADVPTWIGAYEKALAEGHVEVDAVALADQAVLDSQGGGQLKDQAGVQRGGELAKVLTMFYSYFSTTLNLTAEQWARLDGRSATSIGRYAANMALLTVIPAIAPAMIIEALKGGGDDWDDPDRMAAKLAEWQVSYLIGLLVGVRELNSLAPILVGDRGFDYSGPAAFRPVVDLQNLGRQIAQGEVDGPAIRAAVSVAGSALGIPSVQINRSMRGWQEFMEGDAPATSILFGPPPKD